MIAALWALVALGATPDLYQQSYEQEALGAYRSALASLERLPATDKQAYVYALRRGWLLYLDGQLDASAAAYDTAIARAPAAIEPLLGKLLPLLAARRWADAEMVGRRLLALDPKSALGRARTAHALHNLGRYGEAEQLYRSLIGDYPADVDARAGLGWALLQLGRSQEARECFDAVLQVAPKHASAQAGQAAASG